MNEAGFVEGRDVSVEYRWDYDFYDQDRYAELAADLISRRVAVIFTNTACAALKIKAAAAAAAIPIVGASNAIKCACPGEVIAAMVMATPRSAIPKRHQAYVAMRGTQVRAHDEPTSSPL
jgi:hypothetical protein